MSELTFPVVRGEIIEYGLSKREYYAAIALQALIAKNDDPLTAAFQQSGELDLIAEAAVIYADALLAKLE